MINSAGVSRCYSNKSKVIFVPFSVDCKEKSFLMRKYSVSKAFFMSVTLF